MTTRRWSPLLGAGLAVAVGVVGFNVGNLLFFLVGGRVLGRVDYGLVAALLAIIVAAFVPLGALQAATARPFAARDPAAAGLYSRALHRGGVLTGGAAIGLAASLPLVSLANRERLVVEVLLTGAALLPMPTAFLALGALQGAGRYWAFAGVLVALGWARVAALVALVPLMDNVAAALLSSVVASGAAALLALWLTRGEIGSRHEDGVAARWPSFRRSLVGPSLGFVGIALLLNVDVIVAKLTLSGTRAGEYAAVAVIGKGAVILAVQAVAFLALPRVASRHARGERTVEILGAAVIASVAFSAVATAVGAAFSVQLVGLFGGEFRGGASLVRPFIASVAPLGVVFAVTNHQIARGNERVPLWFAGFALLAIALFAFVHGSPRELMTVNAVVALAAIGAHEVLTGRSGESVGSGVVAIARRWRARSTSA
ncbi:MAG: hypothetical protein HYX33_01530 [Actinobacteria bacterium]|nr:hypothetical protein [Actinomycetota bacterium]